MRVPRGRRFRTLIFSLSTVLSGCASTPSLPETATLAERQAFMVGWTDKVLAEQQDNASAGVAIIVVKDGRVVLSRAKGMADRLRRLPITEHTVFEIASLTKPITAIAVMQLTECGKLRLSDTIGRWLPQLPGNWHEITVRELLTHQSGLPDATSGKIGSVQLIDGMRNPEFLARNGGALVFAPGTNAKYNNVNYIVLAEIIERASGQTYGAYLHEHIFAPAGMRDTVLRSEGVPDNLALNYGVTTKIFGVDWATEGAAGIYSSVADLALLVEHLLGGKLVGLDTLRAMTERQSAYAVEDGFYGYGFFVRPHDAPMRFFTHTGDMDGYRGLLRVNVSKSVYYIALSNSRHSWKVANNLLAVVQLAYDHDGMGIPDDMH